MFIDNYFLKDLYINPKNVCTLGIWDKEEFGTAEYGITINGINFKIGEAYFNAETEEQTRYSIYNELKEIQQKIIDEIESE